ncbi:hypothetical protein ASC78_10210 [Variovorax sp. Root318D1]|uniref:type IV secretion system protein n=1 Tax=Variovorax sp. Root318D1 TaxID=1736513 RepID=UPI0006FCB151|nr:type IV secretion system protein [Variovorax sp. Root318D1]KQU84855.1 hypothetical protein ASC78_10210 [Variovorax sp. Root318D1]
MRAATPIRSLIIPTKGFRILTGQSREPMMGLVVNASRTTLILIAASTMALGGSNIQTFFTDTMASGINGLVTGSNDKPEKVIDKNLVYTAVAMAAIDGAQGLNASNSADNVASAARASLIAMLGVAGPPMTAAAMLLMYKVALALFIGFGPIFIMCLMFKVTEQMFWSWLKYGLGTLFWFGRIGTEQLRAMTKRHPGLSDRYAYRRGSQGTGDRNCRTALKVCSTPVRIQ